MNSEKGFTLLEVLVSLAILGFGLLGLAGMQLSGMKNASDSMYRTSASVLARDLADRMHANPAGVEANAYLKPANTAISCTSPPSKICDATGARCDTAETATWDMFYLYCGGVGGPATEKKSGIANQLPAGTLQVFCDDMNTSDTDPCSMFSPHRIRISWLEKAEVTGRQKKYNSASNVSNQSKTRSFELVVSVR